MKKQFTKTLSLFMSMVMLISVLFAFDTSVATAATSGSCGTKATWAYDSSTTTLTISGTGATKDYNAMLSKAPWESYKPNITKIVVSEGITEIGNYNFYNCVACTDVSLPSTLTSLDGTGTMTASYGCFQGCTALTTIKLPSNLTTIEACVFKDCTALKTVTLPDSLTTLGYGAFANDTAITSVSFGANQTTVGENAFYNCTSIKKIADWGGITDISMYSFYGFGGSSVTIPEQVTNIRFRSFAENYFITEVTIENPDCEITTTLGQEVASPFAGHQQTVTIYGHKGSTAETFANEFSYPFVSLDACDHTETEDVVSTPATCTTTGTLQHVCTSCGQVVSSEEIPATGHTYEVIDTLDNTAIDGHIYSTEKCSVCGDVQNLVEHAKATDGGSLTYVWVDGYYTYTNTATCTQAGRETYTCTVDGCYMINSSSISQLKVATSETHIVASGNHTVESWTTTKAATCTEAGEKTGICTSCDQTVTEEIPATGHTYSTEEGSADLIDTVDNTAEDGHIHYIYKCQTCGEQVDVPIHQKYTPAEDETTDDNTPTYVWVDGTYTQTVINKARCVVNGTALNTCNLCSQREIVVLPANGEHDWYETSRTEPTCTAVGKIYYACHNCTLTKSENIDALGHDYVLNEKNSKAPTCTENGYNYYKCSRCSSTKQDTLTKLGHTADPDNTTITKEATCEEDGSLTSVCTVCGVSFTQTINALGHNWVDSVVDLTDQGKPGHSLVTPICSRCKQRDTAYVRHDEWLDGYYTTEDTLNSTCSVQGYTTDTCTICNTTRKNYKPVLGHNFKIVTSQALSKIYGDLITYDGVLCMCSICGTTTRVDTRKIFAMWDNKYVNCTDIPRTGANTGTDDKPEYEDYTCFLDANGDGIINGKDYAMLKRSAAAYQIVYEQG